jgi:hypothetical protein
MMNVSQTQMRMEIHMRGFFYCLLLLICLIPTASIGSIFDTPELQVQSSPERACSIKLDGIMKVLDYDVSPTKPEVTILVRDKERGDRIVSWRIGTEDVSKDWTIDADAYLRSIAWHPREECLFVMGSKGSRYVIWRCEKKENGWAAREIFSSSRELRRLLVGPRPFRSHSSEQSVYRLFFGMRNSNGTYRIVSVTEEGKRFYQVVGPSESFTKSDHSETGPSTIESISALPVAFHPAGNQFIWEDGQHNLSKAPYGSSWGKSALLLGGKIKGGTVTPTPNGLGLIHWQPSVPGIKLIVPKLNKTEHQLADMQFMATPSSVPDGRGIVGLIKSDEKYVLHYVPIRVPLADVMNAWMFCESEDDFNMFAANGGLFRGLNDSQLYDLYESELYDPCGRRDYEPTVPSRPYLVTTDIFWELFASAYEGIFIVKEREQAIPAFWEFVSSAQQFCRKSGQLPQWAPIFQALVDLHAKNLKNQETANIHAAEGERQSQALGFAVNYGELKPRGYYTSSPSMEEYFKAFRYLTSFLSRIENEEKIAWMNQLKQLPPEVKQHAIAWIASYQGLIAPSRAPMVWRDVADNKIPYNRHPNQVPALFPLSWGFDNEVLLSTVYHADWPKEEQIVGPTGHRLSPSGLDFAAALGNGFADSLLETEYQRYPPLRRVINNLKKLYQAKGKASEEDDNLYNRWISALAVQWADDVYLNGSGTNEKVWRAKRLQTGLASWATLRHATVLVNERSDAECDEGGFEEIITRPPRGYVEPDPATFAAIADLFDTAAKHAPSLAISQGIISRLKESAEKARLFKTIAEKQLRGETITDKEYEEILYVGRTAEHNFLVFKSLASKDYGLSIPDPIPKIADVAGGNFAPFLMAAVGNPVEWDCVVPYFGRRQIVKGAIYSYYEFQSGKLINDEEWRKMVGSQPRPYWLRPFFIKSQLSCPPKSGY